MKYYLKSLILVGLLSFLSYCTSVAQPAIQWQKSLGGSNTDYINTIIQTADGGYIAAGLSHSTDGDVNGNQGGQDCWIVKLNSTGNIVWQKTMGGSNNDQAVAIQQTADGGYIVAALTQSNDGDVSGNHGGQDYWIVKLSSNGTILWQKTLGSSSFDKATAIQQTSDSGYIIVGEANFPDGDVSVNHGNVDYWVVKLNSNGNKVWEKSYGGSGEDHATDIRQTSDGGYIIAGYSNSNDGDKSQTLGLGFEDYWIVKIQPNGAIQWERSLGGSFFEQTGRIWQTTDGGYIVNGATISWDIHVTGLHGASDAWVVKMDMGGNIQWQKTLGGSKNDQGVSIQQTTDGGFILACNSISNDGNVSGHHGSTDSLDGWIVKLSAPLFTDELSETNSINIYPNPTSDFFTLQFNTPVNDASIKLYNLIGECVYSTLFSGEKFVMRNKLKQGTYLIKISNNGFVHTEKIHVGF